MSHQVTKPIQSRTQLFPCPHHVYCDIFNCRQIAKWFIGRPDGPRQCTFKLCPDCAKSLSNLVPAELVDTDFEINFKKEEIRREIEAEIRTEYEERYLLEQKENLESLRQQLEDIKNNQTNDYVDDLVDVEDQQPVENKRIYRCLDCNHEAESVEALSEHKKIHDPSYIPPTIQQSETPTQPASKPSKQTTAERLAQRRGK